MADVFNFESLPEAHQRAVKLRQWQNLSDIYRVRVDQLKAHYERDHPNGSSIKKTENIDFDLSPDVHFKQIFEQICLKLNCDPDEVRQKGKGLYEKNDRMHKIRNDICRQLYRRGVRQIDIAMLVNRDRSQVHNIVHRVTL